MEALEFLKERKRMCRSFGGSCRGCPCEKVRCVINAYVSDDDYKRIVAMVEEWSAAHPRKTRQSVFLEQELPDDNQENADRRKMQSKHGTAVPERRISMSWWNAKYTNNDGEYEITFASKEYEKAKAVEKVCCAVMDKAVKSPLDVEVVVRCKDCKHRFKDSWCEYADDDDNFYCARGDRKEGAD